MMLPLCSGEHRQAWSGYRTQKLIWRMSFRGHRWPYASVHSKAQSGCSIKKDTCEVLSQVSAHTAGICDQSLQDLQGKDDVKKEGDEQTSSPMVSMGFQQVYSDGQKEQDKGRDPIGRSPQWQVQPTCIPLHPPSSTCI